MSTASNIVPLKGAKRASPNTLNGKVMPLRRANKELRSREYLTNEEVDQLMMAARSQGRHGHRDATLILVAFRHGLRVSELVALRWDMLDMKQGIMHVSRLKNGVASKERATMRKAQPTGRGQEIMCYFNKLA